MKPVLPAFLSVLCPLLVPGPVSAHPAPIHGELHERIEEASRRIAADPLDAELYLHRADLHRLHRDWRRALADLDAVRKLAPDRPDHHLVHARLLRDRGEPREALAVLELLLEQAPGHWKGLLLRAEILLGQGDPAGAAADYEQAISLQARPAPDHYLARSRALEAVGPERSDDALQGLDEGMERLGPVVSLALEAVKLERLLGRRAAALERVRRISDASPRQERWLALEGEIHEEAGDGAAALQAYRASLEAIASLPARHQRVERTRALRDQVVSRIHALQENR